MIISEIYNQIPVELSENPAINNSNIQPNSNLDHSVIYDFELLKGAVNTLENMPAVEANVTDSVVPVAGEVPTEVVATPETKADVVTPATEIKTEAVPVTTQAVSTKNKK